MPEGLKRSMAVLVVAAGGTLAQSPAPRPAFESFEVATIKLTPLDARGRWIRMQTAHQFEAWNHAVKTLIAAAYNLTPRAITGGPSWVDSERFEIHAETPGDVRPNLDEQMSMLRKLLADRFQLRFHRERKEFAIYALTVAKTGLKFKESTVSPDASPAGPPLLAFVVLSDRLHLPARSTTMAEFASLLQRGALDRPVVDETGLSGRYDFDLEFTADETQFEGAFGNQAANDDSAKPGLFAALQQQLGLKLEATRGPIEALVIDRVERPSEN